MYHGLDLAPPEDVVPSEWAMVCVVAASEQSHRARAHVRLISGVFAPLTLPVALSPQSVRIQIEIEASWPSILTLAEPALALDADAAFVPVASHRLHLFNGTRIDATGGLRAACFVGALVVQISGIDSADFGPGARIRMALRRDRFDSLSSDDPVLAGFANPERSLRAGIAALDVRAKALPR